MLYDDLTLERISVRLVLIFAAWPRSAISRKLHSPEARTTNVRTGSKGWNRGDVGGPESQLTSGLWPVCVCGTGRRGVGLRTVYFPRDAFTVLRVEVRAASRQPSKSLLRKLTKIQIKAGTKKDVVGDCTAIS